MEPMTPNPYNYNLPVGPEMFFGRQEQVAYVVSQLLTAKGDSIALIGGRRMGKTSFLEALQRALLAEIDAPAGRPMPLPILIDFTGENIKSERGFVRRVIAKAAAGWQHPDGRSIPALPDGLPPQEPPGPAFEEQLQPWSRLVTERFGCPPRLILLLDECEHIVDHHWTPDLYRVLRYLLDGVSSRNTLKVVMAGSHRFLTRVYLAGSPLENILQYHRLYAFDRPATEALIQQPTRQQTPPDVAEAVWAESGGHPFLVQYLMHTLCQRGLAGSTAADVVDAAAEFLRSRSDFTRWLERLGPTAVAAYGALLESESGLSVAAVRRRVAPAGHDLQRILEALQYHGLVRANRGVYAVTAGIFRRWFVESYLPDRPAPPPAADDSPGDAPAPQVTILVKVAPERAEPEGAVLQRLDRLEGALGDKLDDLKRGQEVIYQRLDPAGRVQLDAVLAEVRQGRIEQGALQNTLEAIRRTLMLIRSDGLAVADPELKQTLADILDTISGSSVLDLQQQVELSLPILPLLLQYKITVGSKTGLVELWREITGRSDSG